MARELILPVMATNRLSTFASTARILQGGSDDLLTAFVNGAFVESEQGLSIRAPEISIPAIERVGTCLVMMQLDALEHEIQSLGIRIQN